MEHYCNPAGTQAGPSVCINPAELLIKDQAATDGKLICKAEASKTFFNCDAGKVCTPSGNTKDEVCATGTPRTIFFGRHYSEFSFLFYENIRVF